MTIKTLVWDFDGTLCDSYPAIGNCYLKALNTLGHQVEKQTVMDLLHVSMGHCETVLCETYAIHPDDLKSHFRKCYKLLTEETHPPFPGTRELCEYIVSIDGKNLMVTHRGLTSIRQILKYFGLLSYFDDLITADDDFPRKPDPSAFNTILDRNRIDRATALGIGDRELDILAARESGIRSCLFSTVEVQTAADFTFADYPSLRHFILAENR